MSACVEVHHYIHQSTISAYHNGTHFAHITRAAAHAYAIHICAKAFDGGPRMCVHDLVELWSADFYYQNKITLHLAYAYSRRCETSERLVVLCVCAVAMTYKVVCVYVSIPNKCVLSAAAISTMPCAYLLCVCGYMPMNYKVVPRA